MSPGTNNYMLHAIISVASNIFPLVHHHSPNQCSHMQNAISNQRRSPKIKRMHPDYNAPRRTPTTPTRHAPTCTPYAETPALPSSPVSSVLCGSSGVSGVDVGSSVCDSGTVEEGSSLTGDEVGLVVEEGSDATEDGCSGVPGMGCTPDVGVLTGEDGNSVA